MPDPTYTVFEILGALAAIAPIAALAAVVLVDLRALMLVRAVSMMKRRIKAGETHESGDEWTAPESLAS
jgi:hypothetical protein